MAYLITYLKFLGLVSFFSRKSGEDLYPELLPISKVESIMSIYQLKEYTTARNNEIDDWHLTLWKAENYKLREIGEFNINYEMDGDIDNFIRAYLLEKLEK